MVRSKAVLFGINYVKTPSASLRGCVNDVNNVATYLINHEKYDVVDVFTDEEDEVKTRGHFLIQTLYQLSLESHTEKLEKVWIHFSGHGTHVRDNNGEESDGQDECIVPSDFQHCGVIRDDTIKSVLKMFNKDTNVTCIFDCCHSGTIGDLRYLYKNFSPTIENTGSKCQANVCMISGCMDVQTSADAFNVQGKRKYSGAMTSCLLNALKNKNKNIFFVLRALRNNLRRKGFQQYPQLTSSFEIPRDFVLK